MTHSPETIPNSSKYESKIKPIDPEILERLANERETNAEKSMEGSKERQEQARSEAIELAVNAENNKQKNEHEKTIPKNEKNVTIEKKHKDESYKRTIKRVQSELPTTQRTFSKVIHNNIIEKTSELVGSSIARPTSILYGGIFAFFITLGSYYIAKKIGYSLSGSETIIAFIVGWLFGIIIDYFKLLFSKLK